MHSAFREPSWMGWDGFLSGSRVEPRKDWSVTPDLEAGFPPCGSRCVAGFARGDTLSRVMAQMGIRHGDVMTNPREMDDASGDGVHDCQNGQKGSQDVRHEGRHHRNRNEPGMPLPPPQCKRRTFHVVAEGDQADGDQRQDDPHDYRCGRGR